MTQAAFDRRDWHTVIDAHQLESHDPSEWLHYGVALLQIIEPGPEVGKQQQQAALAFLQAQKEGATAEEVAAAKWESVSLSLREALTLAEIAVPDHLWARDAAPQDSGAAKGVMAAPELQATPQQPLQEPLLALTAALARVFSIELPQQAAVLDQLLAAKEQLRIQKVGAAAVEEALQREVPYSEPQWADALQKVLLVLR